MTAADAQRHTNWNDRVYMVQQFLASGPVHGTAPHADYGPSAGRIQCDNCGTICTHDNWHGKVGDVRLVDMCSGCMNAFRFMQFPVMPLGATHRLRLVADTHMNDAEIRTMTVAEIGKLAVKQFQARMAEGEDD